MIALALLWLNLSALGFDQIDLAEIDMLKPTRVIKTQVGFLLAEQKQVVHLDHNGKVIGQYRQFDLHSPFGLWAYKVVWVGPDRIVMLTQGSRFIEFDHALKPSPSDLPELPEKLKHKVDTAWFSTADTLHLTTSESSKQPLAIVLQLVAGEWQWAYDSGPRPKVTFESNGMPSSFLEEAKLANNHWFYGAIVYKDQSPYVIKVSKQFPTQQPEIMELQGPPPVEVDTSSPFVGAVTATGVWSDGYFIQFSYMALEGRRSFVDFFDDKGKRLRRVPFTDDIHFVASKNSAHVFINDLANDRMSALHHWLKVNELSSNLK